MNSDLRRVLISLAVVVVVGGGIAGIVYGIPWPEYKEASYRARIPYKTVTKDDSSAPKGNVSVQQSGEDGEKVVTYEEKFVDGKFKSRTKKSERIVKRPTDEIRLIGTCEKTLTFTTEDGWQITISSVYRGMASLEGIGEIKGDKLVLEGTVTNPGNAGYRSSNLFGGMIFHPGIPAAGFGTVAGQTGIGTYGWDYDGSIVPEILGHETKPMRFLAMLNPDYIDENTNIKNIGDIKVSFISHNGKFFESEAQSLEGLPVLTTLEQKHFH